MEIVEKLKKKINEVISKSENLTKITEQTKNHRRISLLRIHDQASKKFGEREVSDSAPNPQFWKRLHSEIAAKVVDFYHSPDVSRQMPGLKDYVSVKGVQ